MIFTAKVSRFGGKMKEKYSREKSDLRLNIDRFFTFCRENITENTFQDVKEQFLEIFKRYGVEFICTTEPKRNFVKNGKLTDEGFRLYFQFPNEEKYEFFKGKVFENFKDTLFIKIKKYKLDDANSLYTGYIAFKNLRKDNKEEDL